MSTRTPRTFVGGYRPDGLPHEHLEAYGIPARDLAGDELDGLTTEQLKIADDSGLYEMARAPTKKAAPAKAKPKAPAEDAWIGESIAASDAENDVNDAHEPATPDEKG